jgi:hypothetical protein
MLYLRAKRGRSTVFVWAQKDDGPDAITAQIAAALGHQVSPRDIMVLRDPTDLSSRLDSSLSLKAQGFAQDNKVVYFALRDIDSGQWTLAPTPLLSLSS